MFFLKIIKPYIKKHFHALTHRNFRIFWFGQMISLIGSWMQTISQPWLAYTITKSPFLLGVVGALQFLPMLIFSLLVGALIDRFEKKKIIIITQTSMAVLALILAILVLSKRIEYWHLLIIALLQGFANAVDMPTRQSFIVEMVGKEDLMNAIGLNSAIFNGARILGPAVAGFLMATLGIGYCFLINAVSFIPVIIGLFIIVPLFSSRSSSRNNVFREIHDGFKYILSQKILVRTILAVLIVGTFIMNFNVMVPVLAKAGLNQGETGFGLLMSCMGIGSLIGALSITAASKKGPKNIFLTGTAFFVSLIFILIGLNHNFILSAVLLALAGFFTVIFMTTANSTIQLNSRDEFRSRVVSVYFVVNAGTTPIGNLITGGISDFRGIQFCFIAIGISVLLMLLALLIVTGNNDKKTVN